MDSTHSLLLLLSFQLAILTAIVAMGFNFGPLAGFAILIPLIFLLFVAADSKSNEREEYSE